MLTAAILFTLTALGGATAASFPLRKIPRPPTWLALGHGGAAIASFAALGYAASGRTLTSLEQQALALDGEEAFEPAMLAWQRAVLARHRGRPEDGFAALEVAEARMRPLLQPGAQAVQHLLADVAVKLDGARVAALRALFLKCKGRPAVREVAIAKIAAGETYTSATIVASAA